MTVIFYLFLPFIKPRFVHIVGVNTIKPIFPRSVIHVVRHFIMAQSDKSN
jgi:hypothetical protein